ncbi:prostaglandin E2 receptor EP4 subtype-like isoform X1 [Scylla paramamosain]|uniref:prostaglandin E2 receptor EP4 subtype-like isoform X1 n=1 Tax=Scylla paramamosain TaxID=85552 RepID=UPI003082BFC2
MTPRPGLKEEIASGFFQNLVTTAASLVREAAEHTDDSSIFADMTGDAADNSSSSNIQVSGKDLGRHLPLPVQVFITVLYVIGILSNMAALCIISRSETQRYRKQTFMLRCLVGNDLTALLGMLVQMHVSLYVENLNEKWLCASRVVFRAFGLGSGCVALVMAVERWLALTHPFIYPRHVTHSVIRRTILILWVVTLMLVCGPFLGFGLWYDESLTPHCVRYRFGTELVDRVYAYVIFAYGMVMCAVIVCCNLSVIRVLCRMRERLLPRRHSRASCRSATSTSGDTAVNLATPEELSFARLMAILSITFVACWVPQLMTIIAGQIVGNKPEYKNFYRIPDIFILLNFCLDPCMYVLFRRNRRYGRKHLRKLVTYLCPHLHSSPSRGILTDSLRSSSHTSQSNNGPAKGRGYTQRDMPLIMKESSSAGSRYPPTLPQTRSIFLSSSCASPPASPSYLQSTKRTPCQRSMIKSKIDTKYSDSWMLLRTQSEEAAERELLRQEEPLNVVIHAGGDGLGNTYVTFSKPGSFDSACNGDVTATKTKRWSFCYGDTLDVIPKVIRSTASRDDIHLLGSRCSRARRPAWMKSDDLRR